MTTKRHSYVRFYPSDWNGGTARMTRLHRSVYFDICCYNWDKGEPCPQSELSLMLLDLDNGSAIVAQLIATGKLAQDEQGVYSPRALEEAEYAYDQWEKRSRGGKSYRPSAAKEDSSKSVTKTVPTLIVSNNQNQNQNQNHKKEEPTALVVSGEVEAIISAWNEMSRRTGLPAARGKPSANRLRLIRCRVKEHGAEEIKRALACIPVGGFDFGGGRGPWCPNLDQMFEASKMTRLIEGAYGGGRRRHQEIPM